MTRFSFHNLANKHSCLASNCVCSIMYTCILCLLHISSPLKKRCCFTLRSSLQGCLLVFQFLFSTECLPHCLDDPLDRLEVHRGVLSLYASLKKGCLIVQENQHIIGIYNTKIQYKNSTMIKLAECYIKRSRFRSFNWHILIGKGMRDTL